MKNSRDQEHIVRLLKNYAINPSTEEMLCFVAETNGMLDACKWLVQKSTENNGNIKTWAETLCHDNKVDLLKFLTEIQHVLSLFTPIQATDSSLYALLDLEPGASREAIKQRYRQLCRRFHPDTALNANEQHTEAFINITKAYHTLLSREEKRPPPSQAETNHQWRRQSGPENRDKLKKKNILWFSILAIVLAAISLMAARAYNTHIMMAGLRNKGTAFVPPQKKSAADDEIPGRRTPPLQERIEVTSAPEKPIPPSAPAAASVLSAGVENLAATLTIPSQTESRPVGQDPSLLPSVHQESAPLKKEAAVPAVPVTHTAEQTAHREESQYALTHKPPASTNRLQEKSPDKPIGTQQTQTVSIDSLETIEKKQLPTLRQQGTDQRRPPQSAQVEHPSASQPSLELQTHKKIETFLQEYTAAYHQKNLLAFSRFFALDATENGKSLKDILTVYTQLFETTESLSLAISLLSWQHDTAKLNLRGRFSIALTYKNGKKIQGRGDIDFKIDDNHGEWQIKTLTYAFDE